MTTFPQLKPDIWLNIFELLRGELQAPQRHSTPGRPLSSIRQPALASCLRVNKTIYNLASRVLYDIVITDSLLGLVSGIGNPPIPDVISKLELLGTTRKLMLEYVHKGDDEDIAKVRAAEELKDLSGAWRVILKRQEPPIFLELGTVAIGAISGMTNDLILYDDIPAASEYPDTRKSLRRFLTTTPTIHHFCQLASMGCLSLFPARPYQLGTHAPKCDTAQLPPISIHSSTGLPIRLPIAAGTKTRWYVHNSARLHHWTHVVSTAELLKWAISRALDDRDSEARCSPPSEWARLDWSLDAEIFIHLPPACEIDPVGDRLGDVSEQETQGQEMEPSTDEDKKVWEAEARELGSPYCGNRMIQVYTSILAVESFSVAVEDH